MPRLNLPFAFHKKKGAIQVSQLKCLGLKLELSILGYNTLYYLLMILQDILGFIF